MSRACVIGRFRPHRLLVAMGFLLLGLCWIAAAGVGLAEDLAVSSGPTNGAGDTAQAKDPATEEKKSDPKAEDEQEKTAANSESKQKSQKEQTSERGNEGAKDDTSSKQGKVESGAGEAEAKQETQNKSSASQELKVESKATPKRERIRLAVLTLKDTLPESTGEIGPFAETQINLREVVSRLERAAKDKTIAGMVLDIRNPQIGRGKVEELRGAIAQFRASGKKAFAMLETAMPADYLVACACDEIVMPESGVVLLPGIHAEATFFKGLLGKLGIEADFIHVGEYKGAAEPLTRENFSEPVRENLTSLIDSMYDDMVTTIVKDRPISVAQAKEIIDTGLLTARRAKEMGLIDRIAYPNVLREELAKAYNAETLVYVKNYGQKKVDTDFSGPTGFLKLMQTLMGGSSSSRDGRGKKIAVVYALGPIMTGRSESGLFGQTMGSTTIVEALRKANEDKQVAAIVLRIDSPGGSALASDLIWNETQVIQKPIVASMGDVAASGGYYIAMGADRIVATPGTITGSIGVVGGKLAMRGMLNKIGVTTETIERGKNSGLFDSSGTFTDSQRKVVLEMMEDIYAQFTEKAARGRKMPVEKLRALAGGRVYTGRQAKENGLVDQLGTLHDAIVTAKQLAGIDKDTEVKIEVLPEPTNFFEALFGSLDAEKEVRLDRGLAPLNNLVPELGEVARRAYWLRRVFDQPAALVMPFELQIQ